MASRRLGGALDRARVHGGDRERGEPLAERLGLACARPPRGRCPGARPESSGPVCAVTAWRASTRRVGVCAAPSERPLRFAVVSSPRGVVIDAMLPAVVFRCSAAARTRLARSLVSMPDTPVTLTPTGPPETVLDPEPADARRRARRRARRARADGTARRGRRRRGARGRGSSTRGPGSASSPRDDVEAYACFRVGVPPRARPPAPERLARLGLRAVGARREPRVPAGARGLRHVAGAIGEADEEQRCAEFLHQLDPGMGLGTTRRRWRDLT